MSESTTFKTRQAAPADVTSGPGVSGLADPAAAAERLCRQLDDIADRERAIARLQAQQVLAVADFVQARRSFDLARFGLWSAAARRIMAMELADARRCGLIAAERHMTDCDRLVSDCPRVMAAFVSGDIGLQAARAVIGELTPPAARIDAAG